MKTFTTKDLSLRQVAKLMKADNDKAFSRPVWGNQYILSYDDGKVVFYDHDEQPNKFIPNMGDLTANDYYLFV